MAYTKGSIKGSEIDLGAVDFAIDTALSWDGNFPKPGKGDFLVTLVSSEFFSKAGGYEEEDQVLVSRRYTSAIDHRNAASIAKDAYAERHELKKKNIRVTRVDKVK